MTEEVQGRQPKRRRLRWALAVLVVILLGLIVPPLVSIGRYKGRITQLIATSLGRPVRLASVGLRLLPRPGFVLNDLSVAEDPAYGAEPVLHANTVTASIRLLPLWRGRLEIGRISVDEASLNVVRSAPGRWNLDPLFRTAAAKAGRAGGQSRRAPPLPYLEATNSRINFKNGAEKLPFSLINADLSFWQEEPGTWRIRLRGQPARTDVSLDPAGTGAVSLEASLRSAPELRLMPLHLDLEWREAQLGQLATLLTGSDLGWRGNLTADLHLDGTADAARVSARLRATNVHRIEFAPAEPLDFDANCGLVYHYSRGALDHLLCDSPLGDGHIELSGDLPGGSAPPSYSVEFERIPVAAGLDLLRTLRSGLDPGLAASGTVGGKIVYTARSAPPGRAKSGREKPVLAKPAKAVSAAQSTLTGSLTVHDFELSGGSLSEPIQAPKILLEPTTIPHSHLPSLSGSVVLPAGGTEPLTVAFRLWPHGYHLTAHGRASLAQVRELAHAAAGPEAAALDALTGGPATVDLAAEGPWLPAQGILFRNRPPAAPTAAPTAAPGRTPPGRPFDRPSDLTAATRPAADTLNGTVTIRNAEWKAGYLANHVLISEATLHLDYGQLGWDPVLFSYGPLRGTASLTLPAGCNGSEGNSPCPVRFQAHFGPLEAGALQAALLGAPESGALLSVLINRLHLSSPPTWPPLEGTVEASSLVLGPVTLQKPVAALRILPGRIEITSLTASLLGGQVSANGTFTKPDSGGGLPTYALEASFSKLRAPAVGKLLGMRWAGGAFGADTKIDLAGFTASQLAASAKGTLRFEWRRGAIGHQPPATSKAGPVPEVLEHFGLWTGEATIDHGAVTLRRSQVLAAGSKHIAAGAKPTVEATLTLGDPPTVRFAMPSKKRARANPQK